MTTEKSLTEIDSLSSIRKSAADMGNLSLITSAGLTLTELICDITNHYTYEQLQFINYLSASLHDGLPVIVIATIAIIWFNGALAVIHHLKDSK